MTTLTYSKFFNYQNIFYREVLASPMVIEVGVQTPDASTGDFLTDFQKANAPISGYVTTWYSFPAFYDKEGDTYSRERFGLSETATGSIFLSPLQLIPIFGNFRVFDDGKAVVIKMDGRQYLVDKLSYREPLFSSCIALEFTLRDEING